MVCVRHMRKRQRKFEFTSLRQRVFLSRFWNVSGSKSRHLAAKTQVLFKPENCLEQISRTKMPTFSAGVGRSPVSGMNRTESLTSRLSSV